MADHSYDGFISYSHAADGLLAPRLQAGLQRFAKPWWKRRALRLFRDESSLSANPHLWSSITEALDTSGWFVVLLSPDAAQSEWVGQEIEYWTVQRDPSRILPVVTDGEFGWSDGDVVGDAVPEVLRGVFAEEPRWVDLRWAKDEDQLDLQDPRFADAVADIGSALRGVPKDELASEEVRQHRRTVRTAWAGGVALGAFAVAAGILAVTAADARSRATTEAARATALADQEAAARFDADVNAAEAAANATEAERFASIARSRELASAAVNVLDEDPGLSLLLSLVALEATADDEIPVESRVALREATDSVRVVERFEPPTEETPHYGAISPDGRTFVWLSSVSVTVTAYDTETFEPLWSFSQEDSPDFADEVYFSNDGTEVMVSVADSSVQGFAEPRDDRSPDGRWARILVLDAATGELLRTFEMPETCPGVLLGPSSPAENLWPVLRSDSAACDSAMSEGWRVDLVDLQTLEPIQTFPARSPSSISWSADGSRLSVTSFFGMGAQVFDVATGDVLMDVPLRWFGTLSPDGAILAVSSLNSFAHAVELYDVDSGVVIDKLIGLSSGAFRLEFSRDGRRLYAASMGEVLGFITANGLVETEFPAMDPIVWGAIHHDTGHYYHLSLERLTVLDVQSEPTAFQSPVQPNGAVAAADKGGVLVDGLVAPIDLTDGSVGDARLEVWSNHVVLRDGRIVAEVAETTDDGDFVVGPVVVWDPVTGESDELLGCRVPEHLLFEQEPPCIDGGRAFALERIGYDTASDTLAFASRDGRVELWSASTFERRSIVSVEASGGFSEIGNGWIAVSSNPPETVSSNEQVTVLRLPDLEPIVESTSFLEEVDRSGRLIAMNDRPGGFTVFDGATGEVVASAAGTEARVTGFGFSPDSTRLATTTSEGFVRVWDLQTQEELDRIPVDSPNDVLWIGDGSMMVGTSTGEWRRLVLGFDEVLAAARNQLHRGLTEGDCRTYRIDPCPSLEELRGG